VSYFTQQQVLRLMITYSSLNIDSFSKQMMKKTVNSDVKIKSDMEVWITEFGHWLNKEFKTTFPLFLTFQEFESLFDVESNTST